MKQENKVFDFTIPPERAKIEEDIETLSVYQVQEVADFVSGLKKKERQQETEKYLDWIRVAILPIWKNFAEKTRSVLELQMTDEEIDVLIWNKDRFDVYPEDAGVKLAIGMAAYLGIDLTDGEVRIDLVYERN